MQNIGAQDDGTNKKSFWSRICSALLCCKRQKNAKPKQEAVQFEFDQEAPAPIIPEPQEEMSKSELTPRTREKIRTVQLFVPTSNISAPSRWTDQPAFVPTMNHNEGHINQLDQQNEADEYGEEEYKEGEE